MVVVVAVEYLVVSGVDPVVVVVGVQYSQVHQLAQLLEGAAMDHPDLVVS